MKKKVKLSLSMQMEKLVPPGINWKQEVKFFSIGAVLSLIFSFLYFIRLYDAINALYDTVANFKWELVKDRIMKDFYLLTEDVFIGFIALFFCMIAFIVYHYHYFYKGCKSVYLMRRLPNRWEWHKRALTLPCIGMVTCLFLAGILLIGYYCLYICITPNECLTPDQWGKFWRNLL